MSLIPMFTMSAVSNRTLQYVNDKQRRMIMSLARIGERFISNAKVNGAYTDRTGNLRSSLGYVVILDGEVQRQSIKGDKPEGRMEAETLLDELAAEYGEGIVLIVVAGMEYAAAVESKGFDVLTGSAPLASEVLAELRRFVDMETKRVDIG